MFWCIFRYLSQVCFYLLSNTSRNPFEGYACLILGILCQVIQESYMQLEFPLLLNFPEHVPGLTRFGLATDITSFIEDSGA